MDSCGDVFPVGFLFPSVIFVMLFHCPFCTIDYDYVIAYICVFTINSNTVHVHFTWCF